MSTVLQHINADLDELNAIAQVRRDRQALEQAQAHERQVQAAAATSSDELARLALATYVGEAPTSGGPATDEAQLATSVLNAMASSDDAAIKTNKTKLQRCHQAVTAAAQALAHAQATLTSVAPAAALAATSTGGPSPTILGPSVLSAQELAAWFASTGHVAKATVPIARLAADYIAAGAQAGVRGDIAFAQSVIETEYFSFPAGGQLTAAQNNFAGIGACDSCSTGRPFPSAQIGVSAQAELLAAYASTHRVATPLIGSVGAVGCCPTWMALAGKWATNPAYGLSIMLVYQQMLDYVLPGRLAAAAATPAARRSAPAA